MKNKSKFLFSGCCALLTGILILLVRFVDVAPIGPEGTSIGLSHINRSVHRLFGVNILWYYITDWLGFAAVFTALLFALAGLAQWIKRKNILKVDRELLILGGLYIVLIALYLFFEKFIVNYRPIIMPDNDRPEASFPSSHTMLTCGIMGSAMMLMGKYVKGKGLCAALRWVCGLVIGVTVVGRLIAGVHWATDILGGLLISGSLLALYSGMTAGYTVKE